MSTGVVTPDERTFRVPAHVVHRVVPVTRRPLVEGGTSVGVHRKLAPGAGTFAPGPAGRGSAPGGDTVGAIGRLDTTTHGRSRPIPPPVSTVDAREPDAREPDAREPDARESAAGKPDSRDSAAAETLRPAR